MINDDPAFSHDLFEIPIRYRLADVEEHGEQDHCLRKMNTLERNHCLHSNNVDPSIDHRPFRPMASTSNVCNNTHRNTLCPIFPYWHNIMRPACCSYVGL